MRPDLDPHEEIRILDEAPDRLLDVDEPEVVVLVDHRNARDLGLEALADQADIQAGEQVEPGVFQHELPEGVEVEGAGASGVDELVRLILER